MLKYAHRKWQLISALLYNYLCQADKAGQQLFLTKITQATAVATFLVLSISFSYHFGGKTQSFAGWAAVLKGWFSLSSVWRWGCCLTYLFFFSLLIQVNPMHHSPLSPSRTAPRGMPWDDPKQEHGMGNHIVLLQVGVTAFCSSLAHKIQVLLLLHQLPASAWSQIFSHVTREAFLAKYISLSLMERSWDYVSSYLALQSWLFDPCLGVLSPFYQGLLNLSRDVHHPGASRKVSIMYDESAHVSCRRNDQLMDERCESSCSHLGSLLVPPPWGSSSVVWDMQRKRAAGVGGTFSWGHSLGPPGWHRHNWVLGWGKVKWKAALVHGRETKRTWCSRWHRRISWWNKVFLKFSTGTLGIKQPFFLQRSLDSSGQTSYHRSLSRAMNVILNQVD